MKTFDEAIDVFMTAKEEIATADLMEMQDEHMANPQWAERMEVILSTLEERGAPQALHLAFCFGRYIGIEMEKGQ